MEATVGIMLSSHTGKAVNAFKDATPADERSETFQELWTTIRDVGGSHVRVPCQVDVPNSDLSDDPEGQTEAREARDKERARL